MTKKTTKKKKTGRNTKRLVKKEYTDEEKASIANYQKWVKRKPVKFKEVKGSPDKLNIGFEYPDGQLRRVKLSEMFGTVDGDLQGHLLEQVAQTFKGTTSNDGQDNKAVITAVNRAMAILNGIQPQNELEGMLAVQMIAVHNMAMRTMGLAMLGGQTYEGRKSNVNYATKMLNTFIAQLEVLKKYRTGGQQKMIVEHVHVNEGGQAIVGTVNRGGGKNDENGE